LICPKCGTEQGEEKRECIRCGVIFSKLTQEDFVPDHAEIDIQSSVAAAEAESTGTIKTLLFGSDQEENPFVWAGRILVYLIIFVWGWIFMGKNMAGDYFAQTFLHGVNLAFHEAGHVIFGLFGNFIGVLGGSLGQILMPLICMGAFLFYRNPFAASVALWWTGQSFMDMAPYINDARALQLPLLGGNVGSDNPDFHDWHHILRDLGWLKYDHSLASLSNHTGAMLMIVSFAWGGYLLYKQYQTIRLGRMSNRL
jgi:hypothetical protein